MGNFFTDVIQQDPRYHSPQLVHDIALLEPVTRAAVEAIIQDAAAQGITLQVTETYRSGARQQQLFAEGKTQLQKIGVHAYGLAADFCQIKNGKAFWGTQNDWNFMPALAQKHGMISGRDWGHPEKPHGFIDADHVQRVAVSDQPKLLSDQWYPDDSYAPA